MSDTRISASSTSLGKVAREVAATSGSPAQQAYDRALKRLWPRRRLPPPSPVSRPTPRVPYGPTPVRKRPRRARHAPARSTCTRDVPGRVVVLHTLVEEPSRTASQIVRVTAGRRASDADAVRALDGRALTTAEPDVTVVAPEVRGRGLGTGVKAYAVQVLADDGVRTFRTGGSAENASVLAANVAVGYTVDEHWCTWTPPAGRDA